MASRFTASIVVLLTCFSSNTLFGQQGVYTPTPPGSGVTTHPYYTSHSAESFEPYGGGPAYGQTQPVEGIGYGESPLDVFLTEFAKSTWIRLEYLHWRFPEPDDALLGSPVQGVVDPTIPFDVTVNTQPYGTAKVATLTPVSLRDTQGLRATMGIPLTIGSIEANIFSFAESRDTVTPWGLPTGVPPLGNRFAIVTSTYVNGELGTNLFRYDRSFQAKFMSDVWGAEVNYIMNPKVPGEGLKLQPMIGFRHLNLRERLTQVGEFDQEGFLPEGGGDPLRTTIDSISRDYIYAPQLGIRLELVHQWFTVGFEPKVALGVNTYKANVMVDQLRSFGDPARFTEVSGNEFSPIGAFALYGRLRVSSTFSLYAQYDLLVAGGIARPHNTIYYNDEGLSAPLPGIVAQKRFDRVTFEGISIGGELRWK